MKAGGVIVGALVLAALLSLVWTPYSPTAMDILHKLLPPDAAHPFGRDHYGRDVASLLLAGSRETLETSVVAVAIGLLIGVPAGVFAGRGGVFDGVLMRASDLVFAFPALLVAVMLSAAVGPGIGVAMVAIGVFTAGVFARVSRNAARAVWGMAFVQAARVCGRGTPAIAFRHVVPNIAGVLVVQCALQLGLAIIADAGLSYVGLGAQPPTPSWGRMLNDAQTYVWRAPWLAIVPGLAIAVAVFGLTLLGDGLRDRLDPRLR